MGCMGDVNVKNKFYWTCIYLKKERKKEPSTLYISDVDYYFIFIIVGNLL